MASRIRKRIVSALVVVGIVAAGAIAVAWRPPVSAIATPPRDSFDPALVKRGRELASLGNCNDCHMARGGKVFAGGLQVPTPFGTIFSANITPDPETGIGRWSEQAFVRAMRSGVSRDGAHLYPTFPYDHFTKVSEDDNRALYAYLMTRTPVQAPAPANQLVFPLNLRPVIVGWKLLFLHNAPLKPDPKQSAQWNRGAYLVEGLAHCGSCHTPRNALGAERASAQFAGGDVDDWRAYPLNDTSKSPVPWTAEALFTYLRTGSHPQHGVARGPMAQVVSNLSSVPEEDVRAIATYMAGVAGAPTPDRQQRGNEAMARIDPAKSAQPDRAPQAQAAHPAGAAIYQAACAGCHEAGRPLPYGGVNLLLSTGVSASDARNVTNTILIGLKPAADERSPIMPGFASSMDDGQIVALLQYLRARFSDQPVWDGLDRLVRDARGSQLTYVQTTAGAKNTPAAPQQREKP
ncbi:cytochrome c [Tardiphaga sp.]|uniref:c-type cytochrome n=1 Tax=Tardiphaga sp. TaxID=1926292 RepID=UPI0026216345|nr:cytochrome c [Tardiphaga sp.]MDB5616802.1 putative alcohol dehydrogenase cytochrome c subunit protein [Tardiphaga sp.]